MNELPILSPATSCKRLVLLCLLLFPVLFSFAQAPVANFTSTSPTGCTPFIVNFTDQSTGTPTSWQWDLGNGSTSNAQNPSTFYTSAGTYTVRLTVTNGSGSNTITRTNYITVNSPPAPDFTSNLTSGCFPLRVQFTDVSLPGFGTITNWKWSFGTGDTSILPNPQYTYNSAGSFFVILTVTNSAGCSRTIVKSGYINVTNGVVADFNVSNPLNCKPPEAIAFTNTTAGPATLSYQWDFGDGNISTAINPSNNYTSAGPFTVRLIASSTQGCVDTIIKTNAVLLNNSQPVILAPDSACVNGIIN
nr:PKD domain-containing protein [Lacibacter sp.]